MSFAIAAAGTGGHVFPGLAVGEALVEAGVGHEEILYIGGRRLESQVYPEAGFPFLMVEVSGLQRRLTTSNLTIPAVVLRATSAISGALRNRDVKVVLGMGGYVSVPAGLAASRSRATLFLHEQNAEAGLANRFMASRAKRVFGSFPQTMRLPKAEWVGNPVRSNLVGFDRAVLQPRARARYGLDPQVPVLGVFGGSLGAGLINQAVVDLMGANPAFPFQVLHLAGATHAPALSEKTAANPQWRVLGFEEHMELFYAASDLIVARAGGAVAELTVTGTPSVLVPGRFGSGNHQYANAAVLADVGAAVVHSEDHLQDLGPTVMALLSDHSRLQRMVQACTTLARPGAAREVAQALVAAHG